MSDTKRDRAARGDRAASADEKHDEKTGVSRWRDQEGEKDGRAARKEARARRKGARRRRRGLPKGGGNQVFALVVALLLVGLSVAAAWPPDQRLGWGSDFAGGTSYTYVAGSNADLGASAATIRERLDLMGVEGASVSAADGSLSVVVPAGQDAASSVEEAAKAGNVEFVRLDSVSDADAVARIQGGASDVTLAEGTYEPFIESSQITAAAATLASSTSSTYGLSFSFDSEAAAAFEEVTSELAPVYGQILIVVDGTVVASPQVSQAISGGQVSVSAGLTQQEASGIAAAVQTGPLDASLTQQSSTEVTAVVGAPQFLQAVIVAGAAVLVLLVALLVWMRLLGLVAWVTLVPLCYFEVGGIALLSEEGLFVPSAAAYVGAAAAVLVTFLVCVRVLASLRSRMRAGTAPRDAVHVTLRALWRELAVEAVVLVAGGVAVFMLSDLGGLSSNPVGLAIAVAPVAAALALGLVTLPIVRLAAMGPMRTSPGAWGVERASSDED